MTNSVKACTGWLPTVTFPSRLVVRNTFDCVFRNSWRKVFSVSSIFETFFMVSDRFSTKFEIFCSMLSAAIMNSSFGLFGWSQIESIGTDHNLKSSIHSIPSRFKLPVVVTKHLPLWFLLFMLTLHWNSPARWSCFPDAVIAWTVAGWMFGVPNFFYVCCEITVISQAVSSCSFTVMPLMVVGIHFRLLFECWVMWFTI